MGKSDSIIRHLNENPKYLASKCSWHFERACLIVLHTFSRDRFHCLFTSHSKQWKPFGKTGSCDIPEEFDDMIQLSKRLGDEYVLPFVYRIRERSSHTVGLFGLDVDLHGSNVVTVENLAETFYTFVVLLCAVCRQVGGSPPCIKLMSFLYTRRHPVLADVGALNSEKRSRIGSVDTFNRKRWIRFLRKKKCWSVTKYAKLIRPDLFKKRCRGRCLLNEKFRFDDVTHDLICKHSRDHGVAVVLEKFLHLTENERVRRHVTKWIEEAKSSNAR